jgi:hypothetical protein
METCRVTLWQNHKEIHKTWAPSFYTNIISKGGYSIIPKAMALYPGIKQILLYLVIYCCHACAFRLLYFANLQGESFGILTALITAEAIKHVNLQKKQLLKRDGKE